MICAFELTEKVDIFFERDWPGAMLRPSFSNENIFYVVGVL